MLDDVKPVMPPKPPKLPQDKPEQPATPAATPIAIGVSDDLAVKNPPIEDATGASAENSTPAKPKLNWFKTHKKLAIIIGIAILVLLIGGTVMAVVMNKKPVAKKAAAPAPVAKTPPPPPPPPPPTFSPLTGLQVLPPELAQRPVTAIMIENSPDARPQSGLIDAGIVYEAIAEGGITRFLALFQERQPAYIGPIRSVRPYYVDWLLPYDAAVAHVGGSKDALDLLKTLKAKDLDQFFNPAPYHRISSRYAPHNVYSSMAELDALSTAKGYTKSTFESFKRKSDALSATPNATQVDLSISSPLYNVHYDYDSSTGNYKRSEGGKAHVDEKSGMQLQPHVVVAIVVPFRSVRASDGVREQYDTSGGGVAVFFQDGLTKTGKWYKKDQASPLQFTDDAGIPFELNRGQTWITAVGEASDVTFK